MEAIDPIQIGSTLEHVAYMGIKLLTKGKQKKSLESYLGPMWTFFAWTPVDMPNIGQNIICHKLAIKPKAKLVAQKKKSLM